MTDVLAVANQKGGVAKTTTVHSLGVASAEMGRRTLVVDLDPQACLTFSLGFDPDHLERSLHDVFVRRAGVAEVALPVPGVDGLDVLPATIDQLYDAFQHPRADRPRLPLLDPDQSRRYVAEVRARLAL